MERFGIVLIHGRRKNNKLKPISNQQPCIGNCIVNTSTDFCNNQNVEFNILAANNGGASTKNQNSIVMKISVGEWSMLLSGDMEGQASLNIARYFQERGNELQSLVYKMSHHGASAMANMPAWLGAILPTYAFASSAYSGRCNHPRCETVLRLLDF